MHGLIATWNPILDFYSGTKSQSTETHPKKWQFKQQEERVHCYYHLLAAESKTLVRSDTAQVTELHKKCCWSSLGGSETALQMCDRGARVGTALSEGDTSILLINQGWTNTMETVRFRKKHQTKSRTVSKTNAKQIKSCCLDAQPYQVLLKPQA